MESKTIFNLCVEIIFLLTTILFIYGCNTKNSNSISIFLIDKTYCYEKNTTHKDCCHYECNSNDCNYNDIYYIQYEECLTNQTKKIRFSMDE